MELYISINILKDIHQRFKLSEELYPTSDKKKKDKIDEIIESWGLNHIVSELMKIMLIDKIANPNQSNKSYQFNNQLKEITKLIVRIDNELKSHPYLVGDTITLADYVIIGDILLLPFMKFDINKYSYVKRWVNEMEKLKSWPIIYNEFESVTKEYTKYIDVK